MGPAAVFLATENRRLSPVCVALSGGIDSVVLLDLLVKRSREAGGAVSALHVHHGLSPNADAWADFCAALCARLDVPLAIERVAVERESGEGLEAAARRARYAAYARRPEPYVALAHHLDDQAETVLLQLLRGTGLKGVAAMPQLRPLAASNVQLYRPLLHATRAQIREHASAVGLEWIEDESNDSLAHDRNYLRHALVPLLDGRFPGWRAALARFSRNAAAANELLEERARDDGVTSAGAGLAVDASLSPARRANAMRVFLAVNGVAMPSEARLAEMARQLFDAREDAAARIEHAGIALARHRGVIRIDASAPASDAQWRVEWHGEPVVDLGAGRGSVRFEPSHGKGIAAALADVGTWHLMPRAGGEKIRLGPAQRTRTLKNLLQEHDIPAWERERLPLLFRGEDLVWVPGVGIAAGYACAERAEGLLPCWTVAGRAALC